MVQITKGKATVLSSASVMFDSGFEMTTNEKMYGFHGAVTAPPATDFQGVYWQRLGTQLLFLSQLWISDDPKHSDRPARRGKIVAEINKLLAKVNALNVNDDSVLGDPGYSMVVAALTTVRYKNANLYNAIKTNSTSTAALSTKMTQLYNKLKTAYLSSSPKGYGATIQAMAAPTNNYWTAKLPYTFVSGEGKTVTIEKSVNYGNGTMNGPVMGVGALLMANRLSGGYLSLTSTELNNLKIYSRGFIDLLTGKLLNPKVSVSINGTKATLTEETNKAFWAIGGGGNAAGTGFTHVPTNPLNKQVRGALISAGYDGYILMGLRWLDLGFGGSYKTPFNTLNRTEELARIQKIKTAVAKVKEFWKSQFVEAGGALAQQKQKVAMAIDPFSPYYTKLDDSSVDITNQLANLTGTALANKLKQIYVNASNVGPSLKYKGQTLINLKTKLNNLDPNETSNEILKLSNVAGEFPGVPAPLNIKDAHGIYDAAKLNQQSLIAGPFMYTLAYDGDYNFAKYLSGTVLELREFTGSGERARILLAGEQGAKTSHRVLLGLYGLLEAGYDIHEEKHVLETLIRTV